jgi:hypothetical protein
MFFPGNQEHALKSVYTVKKAFPWPYRHVGRVLEERHAESDGGIKEKFA